MEQLSRDVEYAEYLIGVAKQRPETLYKPSTSNKGKSIHQKLQDLYIELSENQDDSQKIIKATNLLSKLVRRDKLNCLVLKLYPGNEGYSLVLRGRGGVELETVKLPYEVSELLDYVDASELPPFLVDLLEKAQVNVFYSGCVILEVRDFRRSTTGAYDTLHVLLKPTSQSLLSDMYNLTNDGHRWTQDDQFALESQLLLATEEPICLDPSPSVLLVANKLQYEQKCLNNPVLKRSVKKYSQAAANRKRKFASAPAPKELKLYDFIHKKKPRSNPPVNLKVGKPHVDMWKQKPLQLSAPESVEVEKFATAQPAIEFSQENSFDIVEEITLERDMNAEKKILAKLTVQQRKLDGVYYGELYLDHDYKEGSEGTSCLFSLGTKLSVDKYLQQFKEIFTEEGRRAVKITTQKPGQASHVEYTQTSQTPATPGLSVAGSQGILSAHAPALTAAIKGQISQSDLTSNSTNQGVNTSSKRNLPIQLSLTLAPVASGSQQTGNQLQLNIQKPQPQPPTHRSKSQGSTQRASSSTPSPVTTPTSTPLQGQLFSPGLVPSPASLQSSKSLPNMSPQHSLPGRKSSTDGSNVQQINPGIPQGNITFVQSTDGSSGGQSSQQQGITNINIANLTGLPPNINIQNITGLPGVNITNLQGLQNMQVSLTGVSMPGGGIAVPVPISLINTNSGVLQNQGIFVSSLPGGSLSSTSSNTSGGSAPVSTSTTSAVGPSPSLVTMVTAMPSTVSTSATSITSTSQVIVTSGISNTSSVITASGGILSPIIGLTPFMSGGIKGQTGSTIRQPSTLPLLQIQGQPGIQLLGLQQQRGPVKSGAATLTAQGGQMGCKTALPTTGNVQLTAQNISGQLATLSQFKPSQPPGGSVPQQQLLQLQHLPYKQLQQIQLKQPQTMASNVSSKSKSKKRTTPTPPKQ